jgi:hypothetical protein
MAKGQNETVLGLRPHHCELKPTEVVWALVEEYCTWQRRINNASLLSLKTSCQNQNWHTAAEKWENSVRIINHKRTATISRHRYFGKWMKPLLDVTRIAKHTGRRRVVNYAYKFCLLCALRRYSEMISSPWGFSVLQITYHYSIEVFLCHNLPLLETMTMNKVVVGGKGIRTSNCRERPKA